MNIKELLDYILTLETELKRLNELLLQKERIPNINLHKLLRK